MLDYIGAREYYVADYFGKAHGYWYDLTMPINLEFFPLIDNASVIFSAVQFALYTHPNRIYLVGCDCSSMRKHFYGIDASQTYEAEILINNWKRMKAHIDLFFPEVEVVSINPIGLAGVFKDEYL